MKKIALPLLSIFLIITIFITCSKKETIVAPPVKITYTLSTNISPAGSGSVTPSSGTYDSGESITITATPATNFVFKNWTGGATGSTNPLSLTMNANKTITAVFEEIPPVYSDGEGEVGVIGGTINVDDENSPLNGVSIVIPAGALAENVTISLSEDTETKLDELSDILMVKFEPDGLEFSKPVEIELPYTKNIETPTVYYYNPEDNIVEKFTSNSFDLTKKTATVEVEHFSRYYCEDSKKISADIELYKLNGITKAKIKIGGNSKGLEGIPTINLNNNTNALEILNTGIRNIFQQDNLFMTLEVKLQKKGVFFKNTVATTKIAIEKQAKNSNSDFKTTIRDLSNNNVLAEFDNLEIDKLESFFDGSGLIIPFNYQLENGKNYYLKFSWVMSNNKDGDNSGITFFGLTDKQVTRKYVINSDKIASFKNEDLDENNNFILDSYDISTPTIETLDPSNITQTSATLKGNVINDGGATITERGFYYDIHTNVTNSDTKIKVTGSAFAATPTLEPNFNYYYRAYAINSKGETLSDNEVHFKTLNTAPSVQITAPTADASFQKGESIDIKATASDVDGNITEVKFYIDNNLIKTFSTAQSEYVFSWDSSDASAGQRVIKVTATDNDDTNTSVTRNIVIKDGNLAVVKPNANTIWKVGDQNVEITWETGDLGGDVSVQLYKGTNKLGTLISSTPNDGAYSAYDVQTNLVEGTDYRIKIKSLLYSDKSVFSDYFEIKKATNLSPVAPYDPSPSDNATITTTSETLFWNCSDPEGDALTYDVYFGTTQTPTLVSETQTEDTYDLTNLTAGQTYYWYIVANDGNGNTTKGATWHFSVATQTTKPTVTTTTPTNITISGATVGGNVTDNGGVTVTERGVYWSTSANAQSTGTKLIIGNGTGTYSDNLTGLTANTTYYITAYATNTNGVAYGAEKTFTTPASTGNLTLTMQNASGTSQSYPGSNGEVKLYKDNALQISKTTNSSGIAQFTNIATGEYEARFYHNANLSTPHGVEYWGKKIITVLSNQTVEETFTRYMPYIPEAIKVYANGADVTGTTIEVNTELTIKLKVKNDGLAIQGKTRLILDTDKASSFNFDQTSTNQSLASQGAITEFSFTYTPTTAGSFYYTVNAQANLAELGGYLVTDGWDWSQNPIITINDNSSQSSDIIFNPNLNYATVTDIDGNTYKTIQIGTQNWMAENLKTTHYQNGVAIPNVTDNNQWANLSTGGYSNYNNSDNYVAIYGRLYNFYAASNTSNPCPQGWHVPTDDEFTTLSNYLGANTAGNKLKETGNTHWSSSSYSTATNASGFTALPSGTRFNDDGHFANINYNARLWSATAYQSNIAWYRNIAYNIEDIGRNSNSKNFGFCIRCIEDSINNDADGDGVNDNADNCPNTPSGETVDANGCSASQLDSDGDGVNDNADNCPNTPSGVTVDANGCSASQLDSDGDGVNDNADNCPNTPSGVTVDANGCQISNDNGIIFNSNLSYGSVTDVDGNTYKTIQIGSQNWMAENLKTTHYQNGNQISNITDNDQWYNLKIGAYSNYNNNENYVVTYGRLYNWYAATDNRKICPQGWHVPTTDEFYVLKNYLGSTFTAGGKLKEIGTTHWLSPNVGATNSTGFTALPGGFRGASINSSVGHFTDFGKGGYWWSTTETPNSTNGGVGEWMSYDDNGSDFYADETKAAGFCIRCVEDSINNDTDGDGVNDNADNCPNTPSGETVDANGCSASQLGSGTFTGELINVAGGTFQMGSTNGYSNERPVHTVTLSSFKISKYEITNAQYADFMNAIGANSNGSYNGTEYLDMNDPDVQIYYTSGQFVVKSGKENYPVIEVSWYGAKAYCEYYGGRLPTEAEWEFAARGGNNSNGYTYAGSNNIDDVAWYYGNSGSATHTVGTKNANELGIYDMSGNVWEWTNDNYSSSYYSNSPTNNPQGPSSGSGSVFRGGSWNNYANYCRVAIRNYGTPINTGYNLGFRMVSP